MSRDLFGLNYQRLMRPAERPPATAPDTPGLRALIAAPERNVLFEAVKNDIPAPKHPNDIVGIVRAARRRPELATTLTGFSRAIRAGDATDPNVAFTQQLLALRGVKATPGVVGLSAEEIGQSDAARRLTAVLYDPAAPRFGSANPGALRDKLVAGRGQAAAQGPLSDVLRMIKDGDGRDPQIAALQREFALLLGAQLP